MEKQRMVYVDYLKVLGLFLVILAHVDTPKFIMQIRNFDVPLLVIISGYLASKTFTYGKNFTYYTKRIQRLVFPAWIFIIIFFIIQFLIFKDINISDFIKAITFQRDSNMLGMLWIVWVYVICAFLIPLIDRVGYNKVNSCIFVIIFCLYEIICYFTNLNESRIVYMTLLTIIPWGTVTYFAFYFDKLNNKHRKKIILCGFTIFILISIVLYNINGSFVPTNQFKYPARLYYFSYSIPISIIVIDFFKKLNLKDNRVIMFISCSSFWIYLWHILFLYVVKSLISNDSLWYIQYIFIIGLSLLITFIQNIIVKYLMNRYKVEYLKVFLG